VEITVLVGSFDLARIELRRALVFGALKVHILSSADVLFSVQEFRVFLSLFFSLRSQPFLWSNPLVCS
jgi:hypothetical protein